MPHNTLYALTFSLFATLLFASSTPARSPAKEVIGFSVSNDAGFGNSIFVVGNHPDLGEWQPTNSIKLQFTAGNIWTGQVAVQAGTDVEYKFLSRNDSKGERCNTNNGTFFPAGPNLETNLPPQPAAPYTGKTIYYYSGWTSAVLGYTQGGAPFNDAPMTMVSTGRNANEFLYRVSEVGEAGEPIQFYLHGFSNHVAGEVFENARFGGFGEFNNDFYTPLDTFVIQDGDLFNYWPPSIRSSSRIETVFVNSAWAPTIPARNIRVYLPAGYDETTWKHYPVLYMHDGQNVFQPGGAFGTWAAESTAIREMSQGRMRECIIVGVDNTAERMREYIPPGDDAGFGPGTGDLYANFLIHNVRPTVDTTYRTLSDPENTLVAGSSLGGIISAYLGLETNVYGKVGAFSSAFWAGPNFMDRVNSNDTSGLRIYLDAGTLEGDSIWDTSWQYYDFALADNYAFNEDLLFVVGCGQGHNEPAWSNRLHHAYRYLLNVWDEPNLLAQQEFPPVIKDFTVNPLAHSFDTQRGFAHRLERANTLVSGTWTTVAMRASEPLPWSNASLTDTNPASGPVQVYRIVAEP